MAPLSFSDPSTQFEIVTSDTPPTVDGFSIGEPTGEIKCEECGAQHENIDEIPHDENCPQRWVRSHFWEEHFIRS